MLIYTADKRRFVEHVRHNQIEDRILAGMLGAGKGKPSPNEITSWRNSMQYMENVLSASGIPDDAGVAIEYMIPQTSKRVDFILTGRNDDGRDTAVIVELKQWEQVEATEKDAIVRTFVGGKEREVTHPSYQAWSYAALLEDYNETVQTDGIGLHPCAYLHNSVSGAISDARYHEHLERAPAFLKADAEKLARFLGQHVRKGDTNDILYRVEHGRIRPSKSLADHLASLLQGNAEFVMVDDQKLVFESALELSDIAEGHGKQVLIVEGGPGTGKSVVAVNLLGELTRREKVAQYVTRNAAPRAVYEARLTGTMKKSRISNLFRSSGAFHQTDADTFDTLLVDEAHRLNEKSGIFQNLGENQTKEIINAARTAVFFLDEDQRIHWKDTGSREEIERWAQAAGATVHYAELRSQFRCAGSDGYLAWLDQALQIRETANEDLDELDYSVEVVDSPTAMRDRIFALNVHANRARMLAGYCWDWESKKDGQAMDIRFPEHDFAMQWNLDKDGSTWMIQPDSVHQIGCIHTSQGLELDYVGVIIGPDLIVRDGKVITVPEARSKNDASIKGYKKALKEDPDAARAKADRIIKNTYRTLMSRGMKGCLIWSADAETHAYFRALIGQHTPEPQSAPAEAAPADVLPFEKMAPEEVEPFVNALPVVPIKAAAGSFSDLQTVDQNPDAFDWVMPPDFITPQPGMFIAQVVGESMNRRIANGAWCLFRAPGGGTREGKIVLVQHRDINDPDTGASFSIKRYHSEKTADPDTEWRHQRIILKPESSLPGYESIILEEDSASELVVVGEYVAQLEH
ncbi:MULTISPECIES: DNA/RNA helicase domain-containing protein [unclassified Thioalkalivibrio]|uniref:DNA/RNA helicase domain-containing protein n=1 Tax=unclassified Thioalkalivibrio TaxID=2621013 RepID=UPI0003803357|nr:MULTISPECIES: DNA/RNA helicase domain-containing protein [unclassified Thioalkalivibrio]